MACVAKHRVDAVANAEGASIARSSRTGVADTRRVDSRPAVETARPFSLTPRHLALAVKPRAMPSARSCFLAGRRGRMGHRQPSASRAAEQTMVKKTIYAWLQ